MKVCKNKTTGRIIETQFSEDSEVLLKNAIIAGLSPNDIEVVDMSLDKYKEAIKVQNENDRLANLTYKEKRAAEYPPIGDQLDCLMKGFLKLKEGGIDVGEDVEAWINECLSVKNKYPKE